MTEFRAMIRLGNDAMRTGADVAEVLRRIADTIGDEYAELGPAHARSVRDGNGNRVGQWKVSDD